MGRSVWGAGTLPRERGRPARMRPVRPLLRRWDYRCTQPHRWPHEPRLQYEIYAGFLAGVLLLAGCGDLAAGEAEKEGWSFNFTPDAWGTSLKGKLDYEMAIFSLMWKCPSRLPV